MFEDLQEGLFRMCFWIATAAFARPHLSTDITAFWPTARPKLTGNNYNLLFPAQQRNCSKFVRKFDQNLSLKPLAYLRIDILLKYESYLIEYNKEKQLYVYVWLIS